MQRRPYFLLHFSLRRPLSLCAISIAVRERPTTVVSGNLANIHTAQGSPFDSRQGFGHMFLLRTSGNLHSLPRSRVHGREHARTIFARLREVLRANRDSVKEPVI